VENLGLTQSIVINYFLEWDTLENSEPHMPDGCGAVSGMRFAEVRVGPLGTLANSEPHMPDDCGVVSGMRFAEETYASANFLTQSLPSPGCRGGKPALTTTKARFRNI
jgi:hypothetical protein